MYYSKDYSDNSISQNSRSLVLGLLVIVVFILFLVRLYNLQIRDNNKWRNEVHIISSQTKTIPAQRGEIYDRSGTLRMVENADSFAVDVVPGQIPSVQFDTVVAKLAAFLGVKKKDIVKKLPSDSKVRANDFSSYEVKINVPFEVVSNIAENLNDLPGVSWRSKPRRNYLVTGSMSHVIGYVGDINNEEFKMLFNKGGYTKRSIVGKMGIEKQYDSELQGIEGSESRTVDARGRIISDTPHIEFPKMGNNIILTIDKRIQDLAEKALGERVGAAVVLRPSNGEILAMVSYPFYDQNIFNSDDAYTEYKKLESAKNEPMLNRVVNAIYPPASTFKTIMSTALLSERSYSPYEKISCTGLMNYGNHDFHCHQSWGHGYLDMREALAQSCDVYYWTVGRDALGVEKIASYAKEFGFGESLEVDLPSQSAGTVPTPQWKERRLHEKWLGGDTLNMSIGQGYTLVTPLHVANMMAMVANGGKIYRPHLLKEIRDSSDNKLISSYKPQILHESNIAQSVWKEIQNDLRYVITDGTPEYPLRNKVVKIAGKTGTAEVNGPKNQNHWHSWMACYAPFDAPVEEQVVVVVLVEAVNEWQWWAPFASNIIFQGIFANQTYEEAVASLPTVREKMATFGNGVQYRQE
ncbi:penicillin-binding protein 2 [Treponema zioleckii]|uniref:penicillin-binding protein 2 n=1 Tax=Treponema zioleckii TaxID=331680 RepID=UPI00168B2B29|nr:penicillin-binding protein 2 [Treponema zioleckii]